MRREQRENIPVFGTGHLHMSLLRPALRGFIFDMDGLLLDTERIARDAWKTAAQEFGFELTDAMYAEVIGRRSIESKAYFREVLGADFPADKVRDRRLILAREHIKKNGVPIREGAREILHALQAIPHYRVGLATSTVSEEAHELIRQADLIDYFHALTCGEEVENSKPAPDIFLLAAQKIGVSPSECIVFEDSRSGARAAIAANMRVIVVPDLQQPEQSIRDKIWKIVPNLNEALVTVSQSFSADTPVDSE